MSNPYPTKLHVESKNFMDDFSKKNKGKKNYEQNMLLDKKMKSLKSDYQAEELEKDFERILSYKKILSHKNSLFFDSSSPSISRTGVDFFSTKKSSKVNILPKLSKVDLLDPKIKTTSTNFFRNRNTNDLDFKNNLLLISRNSNNNIKVSESNNINVNKEINENNIGTASFEQTKKESAKDANSIVNMQSHSPKNLKDEILEEIPNIEMNDNKDYNIDNLMIVGMQNDLEQIERQTKSNFDINIRLESKQSVKSDLELNEKENSKIIKSNSNNVIHTDNKMINDVIENEMLGNENDLDNEQIKVDGKLNENIVKKTENENFPETEDKNNTVSKEEFKLLNIKQKNSAKTYKDMNKDNSLMIKEFSFDQRNRTYLISAKNRIVIDSDKSINEKITNSTAKQLEDKMMKPNENLDKDKDALEKMRKLEEMELNDDLSQSEKSQNKINSSMNHKSKIVENLEHKDNLENDNEIIMTDTKPIENDKTHDSKQLLNIETKTMNANLSENILNDEVKNDIKQNSFNRLEAGDFNNNVLKSNVLNEVDKEINENTKNSDEKINEPQIKEEAEKEEIKNNSKENVSNYFVATNQNFYSSAVNFNPINSNFYSNNNMCAFDKTNSSNNIFSLTTVNNFMSKELNNKQINYNFQIDEKEVYNNNNNNNNSPISNLNKELEDLDNEINNKIPNNNSKNKQFTSEKKYPPSYLNNKTKKVFTIKKTINKSISPKKTKNPRKEHKEIFELDDEENLKCRINLLSLINLLIFN